MTKEYMEPDGTWSPSTHLGHEYKQLKKLLPKKLPIEELAHRLVTTPKQVRKMLKILGVDYE